MQSLAGSCHPHFQSDQHWDWSGLYLTFQTAEETPQAAVMMRFDASKRGVRASHDLVKHLYPQLPCGAHIAVTPVPDIILIGVFKMFASYK